MKKLKPLQVRFAPISGWNADVVLMVGDFSLVEPWVKKNVINKRKEELLSHLRDDEQKPGHTNLGKTFFLAGGGSLIWLPENNPEIAVHEITHAVHHCLLSKDTPLSEDTLEAYAYLTEFLYKALVK